MARAQTALPVLRRTRLCRRSLGSRHALSGSFRRPRAAGHKPSAHPYSQIQVASLSLASAGPIASILESEMPIFLELAHVNVARGNNVVLHDINLSVSTGEHIAILGPNGCGKSTLAEML